VDNTSNRIFILIAMEVEYLVGRLKPLQLVATCARATHGRPISYKAAAEQIKLDRHFNL